MHIARHAPRLFARVAVSAVASRLRPKPARTTTICVGTHHKVLTVFLARVFRSFAVTTGRSFAYGRGGELDLRADVLIDHHSEFDWAQIDGPVVGLHVTRDPRDLLVSAAFYHMKGSEAWMHEAYPALGGKTYVEAINALETMEERLLFEIDNSSGTVIAQMRDWTPRPEIAEARYDQLVGDDATAQFNAVIDGWPLPAHERRLLVALFDYFSLDGAGAKTTKHIRNAASGQWRSHFSPAVAAKFDARFGGVVRQLGYDEEAS